MTPAERDKVFARARGRVVREQVGLMSGTRDDIVRLLKSAQTAVAELLAGQPTDYQRWSLPQVSAGVRQALDDFEGAAVSRVSTGAGRSWDQGVLLIDEPLERAGVQIATLVPLLDTRQLTAMRAFTIDRIKDLAVDGANKIIAELGMVTIGARSTSEATGAVTKILGESSRGRATSIVRTNLGALFSASGYARMQDANEHLPGLQKQWRRSGKLHPRLHHDLADGQIRAVDEPFVLKPFGKAAVELRYPRDPEAPVGEVLNCGCMSIPYMASWEMATPGRKPGSPLLDDGGETMNEILDRLDKRIKAPA